MPPILLLDSEVATVWCHPEDGIVHHTVKTGEGEYERSVQEFFEAGLQAFRTHRCTGWLSDNRLAGKLAATTEAWIQTIWRPQMVEAGWKRWAVVLPDLVVRQLAMQRFAQEQRKVGVEVGFFATPESAMEWLRSG
jgi:hypothetical protein